MYLMLTRNYTIVTIGMHTRIGPRCILLRELGLAEDLDLVYKSTWLTKTAVTLLHGPTKLAYQDMGRERFPTMSSLEDAIVVCQERWDFEWKAKFDEQSLMMEAAWEVSGIAGLTAIDHQMWKENK
eukprot:gene6414-3035_t